MKRFVCWICSCCFLLTTVGQKPSIVISTNKTVSLVFPFPIIHVDRGSKDVLVQQVEKASNILLVKSASKEIASTNLSVVTSDGLVYSFVIIYNDTPRNLVYHVEALGDEPVSTYPKMIIDNSPFMRGTADQNSGVRFRVAGIYIRNDVLYFQFSLENQSPMNYDVDFLRLTIRDKKSPRRTASQEQELNTRFVLGNTRQVKAFGNSTFVIAMDKLTIPTGKYLAVELKEKNGGRDLRLKVNNRLILLARQLPDLK